MPKKVIQVPVDDSLLKNLDTLCKKQRKPRSKVIREACVSYLQKLENEELDKVYQQGYSRIPEEPMIGEAQADILGEVLSKEQW